MMKIQSLLNPLSTDHHPPPRHLNQEPSLLPSPLPDTPEPKRSRISKVAAVFVKGKAKGDVRYPPYEVLDDPQLAAELVKHQIYPLSRIQDYPRHIPYNSEKKSFLAKTGREAFEVFQYTFKVPNDDHEYVVMWDYNIGLTRITPFFKCCKYSKTTPARVLNLNPGLREISHSITGGALSAQGYWMPFDAALAVAATFAHPIRHALIPIFGPSFPSLCTSPSSPAYASFKIDRGVVQRCAAQTHEWRMLYSPSVHPYSPADSRVGTPATPDSAYAPWHPAAKPLRPRPHPHAHAADQESGYGTDSSRHSEGRYAFSPVVSPMTTTHIGGGYWTSVNHGHGGATASMSPASPHPAAMLPPVMAMLPPVPPPPMPLPMGAMGAAPWLSSVPRSMPAGVGAAVSLPGSPASGVVGKRGIEEVEGEGEEEVEDGYPTMATTGEDDDDGEDEAESSSSEAESSSSSSGVDDEEVETFRSRETRAALLLLRLCDADAQTEGVGAGHRDKRVRRAST